MNRAAIIAIAASAALAGALYLKAQNADPTTSLDSLENEAENQDQPSEHTMLDTAINKVLGTLSPVANLTISQQGLDYIMRKEGYAAKAYWDYAGYSIGYGHLIKAGEALDKNSTITQTQAADILAKDCEKHEAAVKAAIKVELTQNQFDSLCIFIHGCGPAALTRSIAGHINQGDTDLAMAIMNQYTLVTVNGKKQTHPALIARRAADSAIFTNGVYA